MFCSLVLWLGVVLVFVAVVLFLSSLLTKISGDVKKQGREKTGKELTDVVVATFLCK